MSLSIILALALAACATGEGMAVASDNSAPTPAAIGQTCRALKSLMAISREELEAARGSIVRTLADTRYLTGATYESKLQAPGWSDCTILSYDDRSDHPYIDHALHCLSRELPSNRAARRYVSDVYACTSGMFSERTLIEARTGSRYGLIGFDGERSSKGRGVSVDFGEIGFVRLSVEASVDWEDVDVTINYSFLKENRGKQSTGEDPEEIILIH